MKCYFLFMSIYTTLAWKTSYLLIISNRNIFIDSSNKNSYSWIIPFGFHILWIHLYQIPIILWWVWCVSRWHWTYSRINIVLTSMQKVDNRITVRSPWWFKLNSRGSGLLRTTRNISIYCHRVFRMVSGINQSYSSEHYWDSLSPYSTWKVKVRTSESKWLKGIRNREWNSILLIIQMEINWVKS